MKRKRAGNIKEFFNVEREKLISYTRKLFAENSGIEAEDIVQEVALNIFSRVDFDSVVENLAAYVYGSIRNRVIDQYRKKKIVIDIDDASSLKEVDDFPPTPIEQVEKKENIDLLMNNISKLSQDQQAVVIATELEGYSFEELSEMWDIPIGTLLSRKHRAIANLKKQMQNIKYNRS